MKCPTCNVSLVISDRSGVEIDYCPECRGVWLDRGELDKIIDRSIGGARPSNEGSFKGQQDYSQRQHDAGYHKKRKDSFLGDLFDF